MHILYITNDWNTTRVHYHLIKNLAETRPDIKLSVYVPLRVSDDISKVYELPDNVSLYQSKILRKTHKFLYGSKINTICKDIIKTVGDIEDVDIIHTANQCVCGAVALKLKKKYDIPYITAIRNTDEYYYNKLIWKKSSFNRILKNADRIIFLSKAYKDIYLKKYFPTEFNTNQEKSIVIQNGVDDIFLNSRKINRKTKVCNIVFYGNFIPRKNLDSLIYAMDILREEGYNLRLTAIGQRKNDISKYNQLITDLASRREWITLKERTSIEKISNVLSDYDIFAMVSHAETFGLVYVEALTQGLPILYSKNMGIDGYFPEGFVGFSSHSKSITQIVEQLKNIIKNYEMLVTNINNLNLESFRWQTIALQYNNVYSLTLMNKKNEPLN